MSQAERKPKEFLRNPDTYNIDDAVNFARDIIRVSECSRVDDSEIVKTAWEQAGGEYELYACDLESDQPQYILDYNDMHLGVRKVFSFPDFNGSLRVVRPTHHTQWFGDAENDVPELVSHLATNERTLRNRLKPTIDRSGARLFEAMAAHYALLEAQESGDAKYMAVAHLMSDEKRQAGTKYDIVQAGLKQGMEVNGEMYPFTRSSGMIRIVLEDYLKAARKNHS